MKVAGGIKEDGIVIGNTYDKYGSRNPIVRKLMKGYEGALNELLRLADQKSIHEVGCGEGYWSLKWMERDFQVRGTDFSAVVIDMAKANARERGLPEEGFAVRNIYELDPVMDKAGLVVCCQVLEHLEYPEKALQALKVVSEPYLILCVPREPVWSLLNLARGKYWNAGGNTPGHIQRWTGSQFVGFVSDYFTVEKVLSPLPWTMLLCKNR